MYESPLIRWLRFFYRSYRNSSFRAGHSLIKKILQIFFKRDYIVQLRSGVKLHLDNLLKKNQAGIFWHDGDIDLDLIWAIREIIPIGGVFIDCGANTGLMGLLASHFRFTQTIFIEPHPRLSKKIKENIKLNNANLNCEVFEYAISNKSGRVSFYEDPNGDDGTHSIHRDWQPKSIEIGKVDCRKLASIIKEKNIKKIDFLKIDTEGNDLAVLESMKSILNPVLTSVVYIEMMKDAEAISKLMIRSGYVGFTTSKGRGTERARKFMLYEKGSRVCFFYPLSQTNGIHGQNTLWCGKGSKLEGHLKRLAN